MKTDSQLQHDIFVELEHEPIVDSAKINVSVEDGIVTLKGTAESFPGKKAAERAALRVVGVRAVANEIDVPGRFFW